MDPDGWQTYDTALCALGLDEAVGRQICNVHLRRLILNALDIKALEEVTLKPDGAATAKQKILAKDPEYLLCVIVDGNRKLYGIEATLRRRSNEKREQQLERIANVRKKKCVKLMDYIDVLMKSLAERYAVLEKGKYRRAVDSDLAEAVVYYMNNRDGLRLFLRACLRTRMRWRVPSAVWCSTSRPLSSSSCPSLSKASAVGSRS